MDYCLPCFRRSDSDSISEREPLISKTNNAPPSATTELPQQRNQGPSSKSHLDKIVDALAALNAGKLPSQEQLSIWLRYLLKSDLLSPSVTSTATGAGPTSQQGQRVISDMREVIDAMLQFGMEKNDDDKIQEIYFKIAQEQARVAELDFTQTAAEEVKKEVPSAVRAGVSIANTAAEGASDVLNEVPTPSELKFDLKTLLSSLQSLLITSFTSPVFKLLLTDLSSILREIIAHAAVDVERVAEDVREGAKRVEEKIKIDDERKRDDDIIMDVKMNVEDVTLASKNVVDQVQGEVKEIKDEWRGTKRHVSTEAREKLVLRLQQVLNRIQEDPASRSALRAILTLASKYTYCLASISEAASDAAVNVAKEVIEDIEGSSAPTSDEQAPQLAQPQHVYPPTRSYTNANRKPTIDSPALEILFDIKDILERLGGRHSLDGLFSSVAKIVECMDEVPAVVVHEVEEVVGEKVSEAKAEEHKDSEGQDEPITFPKVKPEPEPEAEAELEHAMSRKEKRKLKQKEERERKDSSESSEGSRSRSSHSQSRSEKHTENLSEHRKAAKNPTNTSTNPIQMYLSSLNSFLERTLDEPGWVVSPSGSESVSKILSEGVELVQIVGQSVVQVGEDALSSPPANEPQPQDHAAEIKRRFSASLHAFLTELDAYTSSLQVDRTTMRLYNALSTLQTDFGLLVSPIQQATTLAEQARRSRSILQASAFGFGLGMKSLAIDWFAYLLPKLLRSLPSNLVPLPSVEVKSGLLEAGLYASFVQGLASARSSIEPLRTSLVPDEVRVREWTEVRVDMADRSASTSGIQPASAVQSTSRIHVHMDGIRAKLEGVGYFFKYALGSAGMSSLVGYQDEGLIGVDLGMGSGEHKGVGIDIELEVGGDDDDNQAGLGMIIPKVVVQDVDGTNRPTTIVHSESSTEVRDLEEASPSHPTTHAAPLFRVASLQVHLRSLQFTISKSRHWIINKLLFQPLSGVLVSKLVEQAMADQLRKALEILASGLGVVWEDANRRGEERRERRMIAEQKESERVAKWDMSIEYHQDTWTDVLGDWFGAMLTNGPAILGYDATATDPDESGQADDEEEDAEGVEIQTTTTTGVHPTIKGVILSSTTTVDPLPVAGDDEDAEDDAPTPTASEPHRHPPMVYKKSKASMEKVDMDEVKEREGVLNGHGLMNGGPSSSVPDVDAEGTDQDDDQPEVIGETLIAIGAQPQLFPSKGGIYGYGATSDSKAQFDDHAEAERESLLSNIRQGVAAAAQGAQKGKEKAEKAAEDVGKNASQAAKAVVGAERRFEQRGEVERRTKKWSARRWRSDAFDF